MHNMKLCLVFKVLCVLLTLEASRAAAASDSSVLEKVDPPKVISNVAETKPEPNAVQKHENDVPIVVPESKDGAIVAQLNDVNKSSPVGDIEAPIDMAMIQKQFELLKQPGMRRLARQLNRFHQGQLFESKKVGPKWSVDDDDDAVAEERAVRRRTRVRRRNSNSKAKKPKRRNLANRNKITRRRKTSKNSFKRKNAKGVKNQKNRKGLRSGNKKKTKRNGQGQNNSKRRMTNRRNNNRSNKKRQNNNAQDENIEDSAIET